MEELRLRYERNLRGLQIFGIDQASRADQDDAGDALTLDALHVPTSAHGLFYPRQAVITVPTTPLAGRADRMQRVVHVERSPFACFNGVQTHLP